MDIVIETRDKGFLYFRQILRIVRYSSGCEEDPRGEVRDSRLCQHELVGVEWSRFLRNNCAF